MNCAHCNDSGKLVGSDYLDCGFCSVATKRAALEAWAVEVGIQCRCPDSLWAVYQKGAREALAKAQPA